jgi:surfeit locus 1 family protein
MKLKNPPLLPTIFMLLGIIILCSLGTWQLQRLHWKKDILNTLNAAYNSDTTQTLTANSLTNVQFAFGSVSGSLLPEKAILLGPRTHDGKIGNHLIVPLQTPETSYLINLGWTDQPLENITPIISNLTPPVTVTGLARTPDWNNFTPENLPDEDLWYKADINEIAQVKNITNPAPYIIHAESTNYKMDAQFPKNDRWQPKNDHATYTAFWFSMAFVLLIIYGLRFAVSSED